MSWNRRHFLLSSAAWAALAAKPKPRVAAIVTEYRYYSHADVICGRILEGYSPNNQRVEPRTQIVSMYTDQIAAKDMSRDLAAKHGFKIYPTVEEAMTMGGKDLAVDAVLLVGEHGDYPKNARGQKMYPRYELFNKIVATFRKTGKVTPLFSDKHLSYSWEYAKEMYDTTRSMKIPFMAGSSIPVTVRMPELEIPLNAKFEHAVAVGYGDMDAYGFHTLETLQCMVERREGGESGVASVEWLENDAVWKWRDGEGQWSVPLLNAALATSPKTKPGRPEDNTKNPVLFLVNYRDGLRSAVYMLNGHSTGFLFSAKLAGRPEPVATHMGFTGEGRALPHFDGLVKCIEDLFVTRKPGYPVERTLLTTGILAHAFESHEKKGRVETPQLNVRYRVPKDVYFQRA